MKKYFEEITLMKKRYRIVRCKNCEKIFNAYLNGKATGILYHCPEMNCRGLMDNELESVSKEEAADFIINYLKEINEFNGPTIRQLLKEFPFIASENKEAHLN